MKIVFFTVLSLIYGSLFAQFTISGKVTDITTGKPLVGVSVYIINSTRGVSTNNNGEYYFNDITIPRFDLIFSAIGYETVSKSLDLNLNTKLIDVALNPKPNELESVTIQAYEKDGWNKWGKLFSDNIVGTNNSATYCEIVNGNKIKFRYNKKENILQAIATEPIIIINKYLGYQLIFDLQSFEIDLNRKSMFYAGYPFFKQLKAGKRKKENWELNRKDAFYGSFMHFMRSLYRNKLNEDGFELKVLKRFPNIEKQRIKKIFKEKEIFSGKLIKSDSMDYYSKISRQSDSLDYVYPNSIKADSIAYMIDSTTVGMSFNNHLQVKYLVEKEVTTINPYNGKSTSKLFPVSIITIINTPNIIVLADGSYFDPLNVFCEGYWGFTEKLSSLLPVDYTP